MITLAPWEPFFVIIVFTSVTMPASLTLTGRLLFSHSSTLDGMDAMGQSVKCLISKA